MKSRTESVLFLLLVLIFLFPLRTVSCQDQLSESTTLKIEVGTDGSGRWVIERRFLLKTEEDVAIFQQYISEFETQRAMYLEEFSNKTRRLVERASTITDRSMSAENFQIIIDLVETATASYGLVKYQYDWIGFAKLEDRRITVRDVFEGGFYLYRDDVLIVHYPSEYALVAVSPEPDDTRDSDRMLIWYGRRNFGAGEPTVILQEKTLSATEILQGHLPLIIVLVLIAVAGVTVGFYFKSRKKRESKSPLVQATREKMENDEEKVIKLLRSAGGQLYQSLIAKHCGFSTSKTSELLTNMEKRGVITRKQRGREKLVTFVED
ncbi:MAG: helix-turn-helix transcriptional regulator [Candidatus Bathyarchaeia archaeon]